jgi:predicted RNA polymerase sigma factor
LSAPSQIVPTLCAVGGLTTAQIAAAFLVPDATMAQRISRANQNIKTSGVPFAMPDGPERAERLRGAARAVLLPPTQPSPAAAGRLIRTAGQCGTVAS